MKLLERGISPRQIHNLGCDFEEAKAIVNYNWHGFDDVEIIKK